MKTHLLVTGRASIQSVPEDPLLRTDENPRSYRADRRSQGDPEIRCSRWNG